MKLSSFLNPASIITGSTARDLNDAVMQTAERLIKTNNLSITPGQIKESVLKKEHLPKIQKGIATLNYHPDNFDDFLIGVCIPNNPINPGTNEEIDIVVIIIASKSSARMTLNTKKLFSEIYENKPLLAKILNAKDPASFIETIKASDITIKKDLSVADIMVKNIISAKPDTSLKELIDICHKNKISFVPVIDESGVLVGEITVREILKRGIPNYAEMIGNMKFLNSLEPFDDLLKNEENIKAKEIMKMPSLKVSPESSIIEVALEFSQNRRRHLTVVSNGKVVGVVSFMDILNKVLRG